jgi:radical SAM protein with 4Fe4S-binding SPASM domain
MHGEPSLNKMAVMILKIFRARFPKSSILMLSNGGGFVGKEGVGFLQDLFEAGLNTLGLDEYEGITLVPRFLTHWRDACESDVPIYVYPDDPKVSPHTPHHSQRIVHIRPISLNETGTHATLNNHCGAGAPLNDKGVGKRCAKPFREMSVRYDGGVAICCNDWRGKLKLGNLTRDTLDQVWNGPVAQAARRKLMVGERDFGPCKGCDATSYRVGLLPDKKGKIKLPRPTRKDNELLAAASAQRPMAKAVKRAWE